MENSKKLDRLLRKRAGRSSLKRARLASSSSSDDNSFEVEIQDVAESDIADQISGNGDESPNNIPSDHAERPIQSSAENLGNESDDVASSIAIENEASGDDNSYLDSQLSHEDNQIPPDDVPYYLLSKLQTWAVEGVSKRKVDELLQIMNPVFPYLPRTSRGLLHTPKHTETIKITNGELWYKGIYTNLTECLSEEYLLKFGRVALDIAMDGVQITVSGENEFWPIMGRLEGQLNRPFLIAVFYGLGKPQTLEEFLADFCKEVLELQEGGIMCNNKKYGFSIRDYILDAVARSYIKCIHNHNSEKGCEKCTVQGIRYLSREIFTDLNALLRTDESFLAREDPQHHLQSVSPLESILGTKMVSQFRLDGMHLVHLGIMKRFLKELTEKGRWKLSWRDKDKLSDALNFLTPTYIPREFARCRLKSLKYLAKFKASELRLLLLYLLILIFKVLPRGYENIFKNFLLLHACIFILTSQVLLDKYCDLAEQFARAFVEHSILIFGRQFCVYNVHNLIHLPQECRERGSLEQFSAYPFENVAGVTKTVVMSSNKPLQQLINRDAERCKFLKERKKTQEEDFVLEQMLRRRDFDGIEYTVIKFKSGFTLALNQGDHGFCTLDGDIMTLTNIVKKDGQILLYGLKFCQKENFYQYPIDSSLLGIFKVSNLHCEKIVCDPVNIKYKCLLLPDPPVPTETGHTSFLCVPMLHSVVHEL